MLGLWFQKVIRHAKPEDTYQIESFLQSQGLGHVVDMELLKPLDSKLAALYNLSLAYTSPCLYLKLHTLCLLGSLAAREASLFSSRRHTLGFNQHHQFYSVFSVK